MNHREAFASYKKYKLSANLAFDAASPLEHLRKGYNRTLEENTPKYEVSVNILPFAGLAVREIYLVVVLCLARSGDWCWSNSRLYHHIRGI